MSQHDDVSWPVVERIVCDAMGPHIRLEEMSTLSGGLVNCTVALRTSDSARSVLKISPHRVNHAHDREARELALLRELGLPVPRVLASATATLEFPNSYILMEFVEGVSLREARKLASKDQFDSLQEQLAAHVATLHAQTRETYGRLEGATFTDWPSFYRSLMDPVLREAARLDLLPNKTVKLVHRVHDALAALLRHGDCPRLSHGDLWSGNVICRPDSAGRWQLVAILDPEARYGHAEAEVAYMELFQTANGVFKRKYQQTHRLAEHYHNARKHVYQLYGLINQYQLLGTSETAALVVGAAERAAELL